MRIEGAANERVRSAMLPRATPRAFRRHLTLLGCAMALAFGAATAEAEKRAVIVGINSYAKKPLRGCVRDSSKMTTVVQGGFGFQDVTQITDLDATRDNILRALGGVLSRSRQGDLVVFYFSGHGTLFPDELSAELDEAVALPANPALGYPQGRYDSAICPVDVDRRPSTPRKWGNLILDDEIYRIVSAITRKGALAFVISDSCNSGSLARDLDVESRPKFLPLAEILPAVRPLGSRALPTTATGNGDRGLNGLYLSLTSSRDSQASKDSVSGGLFTTALVETLVESKGDITWMDLYDRLRSAVVTRTRGQQEPQLDTRFFRGSLDFPAFSVPAADSYPRPRTPCGCSFESRTPAASHFKTRSSAS